MHNFTKVHVAQDARTELHDKLSLTGAEISVSELLRQQKDSSLQGMILQSVLYVFRFRSTLLRNTQQRML